MKRFLTLQEEEKIKEEKPSETSFNMIKNQKGRLWADIFAPKHITQLIGNSVNIKKFKDWMMSWESEERKVLQKVSGKKKKKPKTKDRKNYKFL